jgi:hypothetical protein
MGSEWQPIETAPRGGKLLLLWNADIQWIGYVLNDGQSDTWFNWFPGELWSGASPFDGYRMPTHWMPLLEPPDGQ